MYVRLLIYFVVFLFSSISTMAEIITYQLSLKDSTQNILYCGFPNLIAIKNLPTNSKVTTEDGYIAPVGKNYIFSPYQSGSFKLYVYDSNNKSVFSKEFTAIQSKDFALKIGNINFEIASVNEILANPALVCYCSECQLKPWWRIVSYDICLITNHDVEIKSISGDNLTNSPFDKDVLTKISRMKIGDRIIIEKIKGFGSDSVERHFPSLIIQIAYSNLAENQLNRNNNVFSKEISMIVDGMAADNVLRAAGYGWLEKLQGIATDAELINLTDNENVTVRNYAFKALTYRERVDLFPILLKHIDDTAKVKSYSGSYISTNELFLYNLSSKNNCTLTLSQEAIIDSILLFGSVTSIGMNDFLLRHRKLDKRFYTRIRDLALSGKRPIAILLLAKFNNKNDVKDLIIMLSEEQSYIACSVREFPDTLFYPLLKKHFMIEWAKLTPYTDYSQWEDLFDAMAKYPSEETLKIFEKTVIVKDVYQYKTLNEYLLQAVNNNPNPIYEPLKARLNINLANTVR